MIEDEQRVQLPRLLQKTLSGNTFPEEARLHPGKLSPTLRMQPLSTATMILPESDPDIVMHDLIELYNQHGSCGIFRVVDIQPAYGKNRSITLNHALDILNDAVYPSNTEEFNGTVTAYLTKLLGAQKQKIGNTPYWQLGTVADTGNWHQEFNYDNILELIKEVPSEHEDYYYTFDFSVFPWRLNLVARNDDVLTEFRASRNIESCKVTQSDKDQCTRLYLSVTTKSTVTEQGRTAGKKSTTTFEIHDDPTGQAVWGIIEKTAGIETDKVPASEKAAWVQGYFERHRDPSVQITIDGYDLKEQTGESIDEMHLARVCRAVLPRYNTILLERIVEVTYPDALRKPDKVSVSMANKRQTTEDNIASAQKEAKKAGGSGGKAKQKADNNETEIERQKIIYSVDVEKTDKYFRVLATEQEWSDLLEEYYTKNTGLLNVSATSIDTLVAQTGVSTTDTFSESAIYATGDIVVYGGVKYKFNSAHHGPWTGTDVTVVTLQSQITQTASEIRTEISNTDSGLRSVISQTESRIRTEVDGVDGRVSSLEQTATSLTSRISDAEGNISTLEQTVDGITLTGNTITIKGNSINLTGVVYADQLDAANARIDNILAGTSTFTGLSCTGVISTGSITSINGFTTNSGTFVGQTIKITGIGSATFLGLGDLTLDHSHSITLSESNGTVVATIGAAQSSNGTDSFDMAATAWYAGRVTAFKTAVSTALGSAGWSGSASTIISASLDTANKRLTVNSATAKITYPGDSSATTVSIGLGNLDLTTELTAYYNDAYAAGEAAGKGTITGVTQRLTAVYSEDDKEYTVYVRASGTKLTNPDNQYDSQLYVSGSAAYNHGFRRGEAQFSPASVTLQGSAHADITPIGTPHTFTYTHLYKAGTTTVNGRGGSLSAYYSSAQGSYYLRGGSVSRTYNGTLYTIGANNTPQSAGTGSWFLVSSSYTNLYYGNGSRLAYGNVGYKGDGGSYTVQGDTQWAYVSDSSGSTTYYSAGTKVTGLYDAGSPVSNTYYTKST